jgi:hypothetical protein
MRLDGSIQQIILLLRLLMRQNLLDGSLIPKQLLYAVTKYCLQDRILNDYRSLGYLMIIINHLMPNDMYLEKENI